MPVDETLTVTQFKTLWQTNPEQFQTLWFNPIDYYLYYLRGFGGIVNQQLTLGRVNFERDFPPTFILDFRLASRPYALSNIFAGAGRKQFAVVSGQTNSNSQWDLRHCWVALESSSAAAIVMADLVQTVNDPATGNPPIITQPVDRNDPSATGLNAMCLPTTAATEFSTLSHTEWNLGITGAASTTNPPPPLTWVDLVSLTASLWDPYGKRIRMTRANTTQSEGIAVMIDVNAATTIKAYVIMIITQQVNP